MGINTTTTAVSIPCGNCNVNIDARARHLDTGIESKIDERARFTLLLFVIVNALFSPRFDFDVVLKANWDKKFPSDE